jgi:hypothetical protein
MRRYFYLLLALPVFFTACSKPAKELPDPEPVSSLTRTITYSTSADVKTASYDADYKMETHTSVEDGYLSLIFLAVPKTNDSAGDGIVFHIAQSNLQSGPVKTYYYKGQTPNILFSRYSYTYMRTDGSIWGSLTDSNMGDNFEGTLTIDQYDAARKLISGHYNVQIKNLINDPTVNSTSTPSPDYRVNVALTGSFENVKIVAN